MQITKFTHACVRIEHPAGVLVIDPGTWSEPRALVGADVVLITHEHSDHIDALRLAGLGVQVFAPAEARIYAVDAGLCELRLTRVSSGERFTAAGLSVTAVGSQHAVVYGDGPGCANLGYVVDDQLYHPGDALHVPDQPVQTLFVPVQASWLKTSEAIDFVNRIGPERAYPIHEAQLNERGLESINGWLSEETDSYRWLAPGENG